MLRTTSFSILLVFAMASVQAQVVGELPEERLAMQGSRADKDPVTGIWVVDPSTTIGGPNSGSPFQFLDVHGGELRLDVPAGHPFVIGYEIHPVWTDEGNWADFGDFYLDPVLFDPLLDFRDTDEKQWQHLSDDGLWFEMKGQDPTEAASWAANAHVAPGVFGTTTSTVIALGNLWEYALQLGEIAGAIPPYMPGGLAGVNIVVQAAVLDPNASVPGDPEIDLSNAIVITALPGRPIKIDFNRGNGGNGCNDLEVRVDGNLVPSITATFTTATGTATRRVRPGANSVGSVEVPPVAVTGPISFHYFGGEPLPHEDAQPVFVRTSGAIVDLGPTPGNSLVLASHQLVAECHRTRLTLGATIIGVVGSAGNETVCIEYPDLDPALLPPTLQNVPLETDFVAELYSYDPVRERIGDDMNAITHLDLDANLANTTPVMAGPSPSPTTSLNVARLTQTLSDTTANTNVDVEIGASNATLGTLHYCLVVRWRVGPVPVAPVNPGPSSLPNQTVSGSQATSTSTGN